MTLDSLVLSVAVPLSLARARAAGFLQSAGGRATLLVLLICGSLAATEEIRPDVPSVVISTRGIDEVSGDGLRLLQLAGATQRAAQFQTALTLLSGATGIDRERPLGVFVYLSPQEQKDPDFIAFLPVSGMNDLQQSLGRFEHITLEPLDEVGWWELSAGRTTIPIRISDGYAFLALRKELLSDPLPSIERWTALHTRFDVAASIHRGGIPAEVVDRAIADLHRQSERDAPQQPGESDRDHEFRSRISQHLGWLVEHGIQEFEHATVGVRVPEDSDQIEFESVVSAAPETDLARVISGLSGEGTQFESLSDSAAPLAVAASWTLAGDAKQLAVDLVARVRQDVERRMQEDGTVNGPAAEPIRELLDALAATAADGNIDGAMQFHGERPGKMLMLAAVRLSDAAQVADALKSLLPLIAETPAVADLELNAVRVEGIDLHRVTLHQIRRQDEWLYGPDLGLYLGAGRDAFWLAVGGYEREAELQALLQRPAVVTREPPPVLRIDLHLLPWLMAETGPNGRQPPWLKSARDSVAPGNDRLQVDLTAGRGEVRLQGTLEAGYIRLLGEAWRGRQNRSGDGASPNLAAPKLPKP